VEIPGLSRGKILLALTLILHYLYIAIN